MKLVSLKVKNYRIHTEQLVEFDTSRTLIGGRNETGKSTLAEAAHRALFMNHRRGGQDLDLMRSRFTSEPPEVELVFEQNGTHYTLRKRFNGTRGHVELESGHHERWQGNDAEEKLAVLLGYDAPVSPGQADSQWAHLWIRQGKSGEDPSGQATIERDSLLARLQAQGGAAVMQSELDARVAGRFSDASAARFNQNGTPRAGSDFKKASDALEEAKLQLEERRNQTARLTQAAQAFASAAERRTSAIAAIPEIEKLIAETQEKLTAATAIQFELTEAARQHAEAQRNYHDLHENDVKIRGIAADIEAKALLMEPLRSASEQASARLVEMEAKLHTAHQQAQHAAEDLQRARDLMDWLRALDEYHKAVGERAAIRQRQVKIEDLRTSLAEPTSTLAQLPEIQSSDLDKLRKLDGRKTEAAAALKAIATGIDFLEGPSIATLAGSAFTPGESHVITEAAEIEVAGHRFRIRPGGGNRLNESREALGDLNRQLASAFQKIGIADLAAAIHTLELRNAAEVRCQQIRTQIDTLEPAITAQQLESLEASCLRLESSCQRLREKAGVDSNPEDIAADPLTASQSLEALETSAKTTAALIKDLDRQLTESKTAAGNASLKFQNAQKEHDEGLIHHRALTESHGDNDSRRERLANFQLTEENLRQQTSQLRASLTELQPDNLKNDRERYQRSLDKEKAGLQQAEIDAATARATLQRDGSQDPHSAEREAEAALERATEVHVSERRRAEAVRRLADLFREEQQQLSDRFTGPLVDRISGYLQCLFGPQARAKMTLASGSFTGLQIIVLTCTPTDYTTLGARSIILEPPVARPASEMPVARDLDGSSPQSERDEYAPVIPTLVSTDDMERLLRTLSDLGGKSGNQSLRDALGWDEGRYLATKDILLTRGNLIAGRGRGGSVSIP